MSAFTALLHKEFRQQASIWLALVVVTIFNQGLFTLGFAMQANPPSSRVKVAVLFSLAWVLTTVYVYGSAGSVFVTEHEEKTYGFLRGLPIRRGTLLAAKLGWTLLGALSFMLFLAVETTAWIFLTIPSPFSGFDSASGVDGSYEIAIALFHTIGAAFVWGLFWSVRCRNQLFALLATFVSAAAVASLCKYYLATTDYELATVVGVEIVVAIKTWYDARFWFDRWIDRKQRLPFKEPRVERYSAELGGSSRNEKTTNPGAARSTAPLPALFALVWQAIRQSGWLFTFGSGVGVVCIVSRYFILDPYSNWWNFIFFGVTFTTCVFCGSIFTADHRNNTVAMLGHRGVKPSTIWWSRIIAFGGAYFLFVIASALLIPKYPSKSMLIVPFFAIPFCCGALISLLFRSPILAPCLTAAAWVCVLTWSVQFAMLYDGFTFEVGISVAYLSTAPLLVGFLIASRLRIGDWLRERSLWRSRRPVVGFIVGPTLLLLATIPFIRVYSVPTLNFGYFADTTDLRTIPNEEFDKLNAINVREIDSPEDFKRLREKYRMFRQMKEKYRQLRGSDTTEHLLSTLNNILLREVRRDNFTELVVKHRDFVTPEFASEAIAFLETLGKDRIPSVDRVRSAYENDCSNLKSFIKRPELFGDSANNRFVAAGLFWMPWERIHTEKMLWNEFQVQSRYAERTDDAVFGNKGDFESLLRNYAEHSRTSPPPAMIFSWRIYDVLNSPSPQKIYETELQRRALILQFAFLKFGLEKNRMPDKLDDLVAAGILKELPTVPATGEPFEYHKANARLSARVIIDMSPAIRSGKIDQRNIDELRKNMRRFFEIERFPQ